MTKTDEKPEETRPVDCVCVRDPFVGLPPELRPRPKPRLGNLRQVTCPGCGLQYWTNRSTELCTDCQKKGVKIPR
jgi:hypothetical protein